MLTHDITTEVLDRWSFRAYSSSPYSMAFATRETDAPFILERVNDLNERPLQETDVEYLCRVLKNLRI